MMTDPIADMLTRIRNALASKKEGVDIPFSKLKKSISEILQREKYIREWSLANDGRTIHLSFRYGDDGSAVLRHLRRISKPGQRQYAGKRGIPKVLGGMGMSIVSTSKGLMTDVEARKLGVGGEVMCEIY